MPENILEEFRSESSSGQDLQRQFYEELYQGNHEPAQVSSDFEAELQKQEQQAAQVEVQEEEDKEEEEVQDMIERQGNDDAQNQPKVDGIPHDPEYDAFMNELLRDAHDNDSVTSGELARYEQSIRVTIPTAKESYLILKTAK